MANKIITHKVRNPKYETYSSLTNTTEEQRWLNIWSAEVDSNSNNYIITPSNNWSIPGDKISFTFTSPNKIVMTGNNELNEGPAIKSNGSPTKFLNEKGDWIEVKESDPITLTTTSENNVITKITIGHGTTISNYNSNNNSINLTLNNDDNSKQSILSFNEYGHITTKNNVNIPLASSTSAGLAPATGTNNANKILKINNDGSISWANPTDSIPVVTNSADGLAPLFGSNANGKILSIETNTATWKNITDILSSEASGSFSNNEIQKVFVVQKNGQNTTSSWINYNPNWRRFYWKLNQNGTTGYLNWEGQSNSEEGTLIFERTPLDDFSIDGTSWHELITS